MSTPGVLRSQEREEQVYQVWSELLLQIHPRQNVCRGKLLVCMCGVWGVGCGVCMCGVWCVGCGGWGLGNEENLAMNTDSGEH